MTGGLLTNYEAALIIHSLLALDSEIALLTLRPGRIVERLRFNGSNPVDVLDAWETLSDAYGRKDGRTLNTAAERMDALMRGEEAETANGADIERLTLRLATLVQAEG